MARLVLLNGPPTSGKSTLAARMVCTRPLALNLDIDIVRGLLGAWTDSPNDAGIAARRLAIAMAEAHLVEGLDVVVPQFLAREAFIRELEATADRVGAQFVEIALLMSRTEMLRAFAEAQCLAPESAASGRTPARRTIGRDRRARRDA